VTAEGTLAVRLAVEGGRVASVGISSTRPLRAARVLAARAPDDVLRLAPLLFPVCGTAHGVACARALEDALGQTPDARLEVARDVACLCEAAVSHAWQLAIAWREAAGVPADTASVRTVRRAFDDLRAALFEGRAATAPLRAAPAFIDARSSVVALLEVLDELCLGKRLFSRSSVDPAAPRSIRGHCHHRRPGSSFDRRLLEADPAFGDHPLLDGAPVDVSAYARQRDSDAVRSVEAEHGGGLMARLVARRVDAKDDATRLAARFGELERGVAKDRPSRASSGTGWEARAPRGGRSSTGCTRGLEASRMCASLHPRTGLSPARHSPRGPSRDRGRSDARTGRRMAHPGPRPVRPLDGGGARCMRWRSPTRSWSSCKNMQRATGLRACAVSDCRSARSPTSILVRWSSVSRSPPAGPWPTAQGW